jgi:predicted kinase
MSKPEIRDDVLSGVSILTKQKIIVLMGVPGAGKTTWLNAQDLSNFHLASTEPVRVNKELDVDYFMHKLRVDATVAAEDGLSIVSDGTNLAQRHRWFWLNLAKSVNAESNLVVFDTDLSLCLKAQDIRLAPVDKKLVRKYGYMMQQAKRVIHSEPWDSIETIRRVDRFRDW